MKLKPGRVIRCEVYLPTKKTELSNHHIFLDESGDHTWNRDYSVGHRYLGLVGVVFNRCVYPEFKVSLQAFKAIHFPTFNPPPVLHRVDIVNQRGPFSIFNDLTKRKQFDDDLLDLIRATTFRLIAVVIDKIKHSTKTYRTMKHPYHYCLQGMLERYCGFLKQTTGTGDVIVESRGRLEDKELKSIYEEVYRHGTKFLLKDVLRAVLTEPHLIIMGKGLAEPGLELADLLAHTVTRDVLFSNGRIDSQSGAFTEAIAQLIRAKYHRNHIGKIAGFGSVLLT